MKKLLLLFLPVLILTGAGCSSSDQYSDSDDYYYDDPYYSDTYENSYDTYSDIPQGYQDVYACDLTSNSCLYIEANINGSSVISVYTSYYIYPRESFCDSIGCYFIDDFSHEWYFDF